MKRGSCNIFSMSQTNWSKKSHMVWMQQIDYIWYTFHNSKNICCFWECRCDTHFHCLLRIMLLALLKCALITWRIWIKFSPIVDFQCFWDAVSKYIYVHYCTMSQRCFQVCTYTVLVFHRLSQTTDVCSSALFFFDQRMHFTHWNTTRRI
jgi:hypothetical protein